MNDVEDSPLGRYIRVVETLVANGSEMTLVQVAAEMALPAASVHRLVTMLTALNLVSKSASGKAYSIGPRMRNLGLALLSRDTIVEIVHPFIKELADAFGEVVFVTRKAGLTAETIAIVQPDGSSGAIVFPGRELPPHAAASAKAIFAFQPDEIIVQVLAQKLEKYTEDTKISRQAILAEYEQIRKSHFSKCDNEVDVGVLTYATPIFIPQAEVQYALGVCGLKTRLEAFPVEVVEARLKAQAARIAERLAFPI